MTIRIHQVKIAPKYFNAVVADSKKAELRKDDRGYKVGDVLSFCEWRHGSYTGREWVAVITHILPINEVVAVEGQWVILSIRSLTPLDALSYIISGGAI